jgi:hypothetical protein
MSEMTLGDLLQKIVEAINTYPGVESPVEIVSYDEVIEHPVKVLDLGIYELVNPMEVKWDNECDCFVITVD